MWENAETKVSKERRNSWSSRITDAVPPALHKYEPQSEPRNPLRPLEPKVSRVPLALVLQSTRQSKGFTSAYPLTLLGLQVETISGSGMGKNPSPHSFSHCLHWDLLGCCFPCCWSCCFNLLFSIFYHK